ncbi:hypothetical protein APV55_11845 [Staphylococcus aureus]|uniref:hypothetical protein n=1 Tax=Staphylococcus aureus TaxID=1280 RepID=UPI000BD1D404|nr:hypothetical protein [Staphylococcus aureus]PAG54134.1 hypothetical protein APV55_11845 [Staphylococcus aureus]
MKLEELLLITQQPLIEYSKNKKLLEGSRLFDIDERMDERKIPKILTNSDKYHVVEIANYDNFMICPPQNLYNINYHLVIFFNTISS